MFGLSRAEKLKRHFDKNGINTVGEITYIGNTPVDQFFTAQFGDNTYQAGEQVQIRYIKTENGYCGYILREEESSL